MDHGWNTSSMRRPNSFAMVNARRASWAIAFRFQHRDNPAQKHGERKTPLFPAGPSLFVDTA
jgi:hypothetical protein